MYSISNIIDNQQLKLAYFKDLAKGLYFSTGINVEVINNQSDILYSYGEDSLFLSHFPLALDGFSKHLYKSRAKSTNGVSTFTTIYGFSYMTATIGNESSYFGTVLLGPVLLEPFTDHLLSNILNNVGLPLTKRSTIKSKLSKIPVINPARNYYLTNLLHNQIAANAVTTLESIEYDIETVDLESFQPVTNFSQVSNYNYGLERLFISKVMSGDVDNVKDIFHNQIRTHYFVNLGIENLRPIKNNGIMFSALLARSTIKGGVEPNISLALADHYVNRIEDVYRYTELIQVIEKMVIDFTEHVLQITEVNHASVVKKVTKYIHAHLAESIRLNDVAEYINLSPNYFSSLFKREMGIAFADYLNQIRIKESQYLLETTEYPISDIAQATGFNNQNYFTTIFRKHTGTTPKQYRMKVSIK